VSGHAIRYPVAIGSPVDKWAGVQLGLGLSIWEIRYVAFMEPTNPARSAGPFRMDVFVGTTHIIEIYEKVQIGANVYLVP
jgi:hypothetical protein